jgi:hypothetical protein
MVKKARAPSKRAVRKSALESIDDKYRFRPGTYTQLQKAVLEEVWKWARKDAKQRGQRFNRPKSSTRSTVDSQTTFAKANSDCLRKWAKYHTGCMDAIEKKMRQVMGR